MKHLFGEEGVRKCDILAIQEPEIFNWMEPEMGVHSQTLGGRFHTLLRPTPTAVREEAARTQPRVCFFVSKGINPKSWSIRHHSRDASTLTVETGAGQLHVHNIYLPGKFNDPERTQEVKEGLAALCVALRGYHSGQHVVVGDFNLHHPLWSTIQQAQLPDDDADDLIRIMGDFGLDLLTEKGTVTFEGPVYGNIVRSTIDLTWTAASLADRVIRCTPCRQWWYGADHVPILTEFDVRTSPAGVRERQDWRATDWEAWCKALERYITKQGWSISGPGWVLDTAEKVDEAVKRVMDAVSAASKDTVPVRKIHPGRSYPTYTPALAPLKQQVRRARRTWQSSHNEEDHEAFRQLRHQLGRESKKMGRQAHRERVEEATTSIDGFWRLAKWARSRGVPRSSHTPTLRVGEREFTTTDEKAACFRTALFPPAPTADLSDIDGYTYPDAVPMPTTVSPAEVEHAIRRATPYNAPGPSSIPNAVWKHGLDVPGFSTFITAIFNACIILGYCPRAFRDSITVVIRKPGKPDYTNPNAWRPISLLETLGKALESIIATRLSYLAEEYGLLPETHIGGRGGRSCDHAIHMLLEAVYDAWRKDRRVASLLTLDGSGAFDNVSHIRLIHCLRKRRIPEIITNWLISFLSNRSTTLLLQEGRCANEPVATGIPQGSPLSPILYLFYNSDLIDDIHAAAPGRVLVTGYIDDICILVWGVSPTRNCQFLSELHAVAETWAKRHASKFSPSKYGLIHFWKRGAGALPPYGVHPQQTPALTGSVTIQGVEIKPVASLRYLGVILNENLTARDHLLRCRKRAAVLTAALRSIAGMTWGVTTLHLRRMWTAVLFPQISFGCSTWYTKGAYQAKTTENEVNRALESMQYQALYRIAGAFRTTSRAALQILLYVLPAPIATQRLAELTCLRIHTHPLRTIFRRRTPVDRATLRLYCQDSHRNLGPIQKAMTTPLQRLEKHLQDRGIDVHDLELIKPYAVAPWWQPPKVQIAASKDTAIAQHNEILRAAGPYGPNTAIAYTDGSKLDNPAGVGAAALTSVGREVAVLHPTDSIYVAELHGIKLALRRFDTEISFRQTCEGFRAETDTTDTTDTTATATIFTDSQAAILAFARPRRSSGQYVLREIAELLDRVQPVWQVRINWLPGHVGVAGNERVDQMAKEAAESTATPTTTPLLLTAAKATLREQTLEAWTREWTTSAHGEYVRDLFPEPTKAVFQLHEPLRRPTSAALIQMQAGKLALPAYLSTISAWRDERVARALENGVPDLDPSACHHCERGKMDTKHVLLTCPRFATLRANTLGIDRPPGVWTSWLTEPERAPKAASFILATRLLGQFRHLPETYHTIAAA
ncbi:reverse transcriptase [Penicillium odoratum]|nr:reverse transcriptase [Penicillium odoratum]XP_056999886.1 reverse transcriptase [Penicillium odoratum]KAJ5765559.1 reverse transcriptase [Penicillium odoratum]KAJ5776769.1 reverse transcriptase [Penicillium odoratum]